MRSNWITSLHAGRYNIYKGNGKAKETTEEAAADANYYEPTHEMIDVESVQDTLTGTVSSLHVDLVEEIKHANVRRKVDAEAKKTTIIKIMEGVYQRLDGNNVIL